MTAHSGLAKGFFFAFSSSAFSFAFSSNFSHAAPLRTVLEDPDTALPRDTKPFGFATGLMRAEERTAGP